MTIRQIKFLVPLFPAGQEPLPPGIPEEDRPQYEQNKKIEKYMGMAAESCAFKSATAGVFGFGIGAFFSMMQASFAIEDPLSRADLSTRQKTAAMFKEMGQNMYRSGRGFGKVGAIYAGVECVIESYRARNDMTNGVLGGFVTGGILARASGPKAAVGGGLAFAAFSAAIELFLRREAPDDD